MLRGKTEPVRGRSRQEGTEHITDVCMCITRSYYTEPLLSAPKSVATAAAPIWRGSPDKHSQHSPPLLLIVSSLAALLSQHINLTPGLDRLACACARIAFSFVAVPRLSSSAPPCFTICHVRRLSHAAITRRADCSLIRSALGIHPPLTHAGGQHHPHWVRQ